MLFQIALNVNNEYVIIGTRCRNWATDVAREGSSRTVTATKGDREETAAVLVEIQFAGVNEDEGVA